MFCPSCGALIDDGLSFCSQCGSILNNAAPQYSPMEDHPTELFNENAYQPVTDYAPPQDAYPSVDYNPAYADAPVYNQAPPVYQNVQPAYNQYQNPPAYNQTGYVGYANPYAGLEKPKRDPGKVCGILSLIFSLVGYPFLICYGAGLVYWLAALILGFIGLSASKRNGFKNGKAKAGIIITLIPFILGIVACIIGLFILVIVGLTEGF
ncbi:MAG: zinc-ribbon domain-containing protein [Clostridia bacterium]|nr:zinc-ribbon domain-containing protein [Clostridia bacterium]